MAPRLYLTGPAQLEEFSSRERRILEREIIPAISGGGEVGSSLVLSARTDQSVRTRPGRKTKWLAAQAAEWGHMEFGVLIEETWETEQLVRELAGKLRKRP